MLYRFENCKICFYFSYLKITCPISDSQAPLVDEHKKEELMKMYRNSPNRSHPSKKDDPYTMAVSLARRLYMLDGFKKSEIAQKLADP